MRKGAMVLREHGKVEPSSPVRIHVWSRSLPSDYSEIKIPLKFAPSLQPLEATTSGGAGFAVTAKGSTNAVLARPPKYHGVAITGHFEGR
jgi:hypothetical protein